MCKCNKSNTNACAQIPPTCACVRAKSSPAAPSPNPQLPAPLPAPPHPRRRLTRLDRPMRWQNSMAIMSCRNSSRATDCGSRLRGSQAAQQGGRGAFRHWYGSPDNGRVAGAARSTLSVAGRRMPGRWKEQKEGGPRPVACGHSPAVRFLELVQRLDSLRTQARVLGSLSIRLRRRVLHCTTSTRPRPCLRLA